MKTFIRIFMVMVLVAAAVQAHAIPTATTSAATSITTSSAILNGTGNPNAVATTGWFRLSTTNPSSCNDTFGSRVPATGGTDLGAGGAAIPYSIASSGLTSGVTYYYCAIAQSAEGTGFGSLFSFTTPTSPTVTTSAATSVTSGGATLNGTVNPNLNAANGFYRYSTTDPGTCSDSFGTRVPSSSSSDTSLGSGSTPVAYSRAITGLTPATAYYYCAIGYNSYGTAFGAVFSLTTLAATPTVTTNSATFLTGATATLNASANPGGAATTGWFRYATASPGTCNDSFGTRAPASGGSSLGAGTSSSVYSQGITGLTPGTTYYYCGIAQNSVGTSFGSVVSSTTPLPPTTNTFAASSITNTTATLNGQSNPNGATTTGWFRFATTNPGTCNGIFGQRSPFSGGSSLGSGSSNAAYSQGIAGLTPGTTYYYCAIAQSAEGTGFGSVLSLTTPAAPVTASFAATLVTSGGATLNGSANPNLASSTGWFRYNTSNPGSCNDSFGTLTSSTSLGSGSTPVSYSNTISGLTPATTYYFCSIANNAYGTAFGAVLSFTTPAAAPMVTTSSATALTGSTATLNGSANPGGDATTGWFRYATASPGTCNDSFGTRAPATGGSSLGAGLTSIAYSRGISGLSPGTNYYYCAIVQNSVGMALGTLRTFTLQDPTLTITIVGNGSVNSQNGQGLNYACASASCSAVFFGAGDTVTLTPTGSNSSFSAWSGDYVSTSNPGSITMDGDKAVTASFTADPARVRIEGDPTTLYYSLGAALSAPTTDDEIRAQGAPDFSETIISTNSHNLKLRGGFINSDFSDVNRTGYSTLIGSLKIQAGKLTVERMKIKAP